MSMIRFFQLRIKGPKFVRNLSTPSRKPSYIHRIENNQLKYVTIGQLLKTASIKYPNIEAIVSCAENSKITFAETLEKVIYFKR